MFKNNMMKINKYSVELLSLEDSINTNGGDNFMSDLGSFCGWLIGSVVYVVKNYKPDGITATYNRDKLAGL